MLYGSESVGSWPVKEESVIRSERNDARMGRWIYNIRPQDRIPEEELRTRLKLKGMRECLQDRRLRWLGHLDRMEEGAWYSKCRTFKVNGSFPRGRSRKTCNGVTRSDLRERKARKSIAKDRNNFCLILSCVRNCQTHASFENKC